MWPSLAISGQGVSCVGLCKTAICAAAHVVWGVVFTFFLCVNSVNSVNSVSSLREKGLEVLIFVWCVVRGASSGRAWFFVFGEAALPVSRTRLR